MRREIKHLDKNYPVSHNYHEDSKIRIFDKVLVDNNRIAVVESISNKTYNVIALNQLGIISHESYSRCRLQKITIIPFGHTNINSK